MHQRTLLALALAACLAACGGGGDGDDYIEFDPVNNADDRELQEEIDAAACRAGVTPPPGVRVIPAKPCRAHSI